MFCYSKKHELIYSVRNMNRDHFTNSSALIQHFLVSFILFWLIQTTKGKWLLLERFFFILFHCSYTIWKFFSLPVCIQVCSLWWTNEIMRYPAGVAIAELESLTEIEEMEISFFHHQYTLNLEFGAYLISMNEKCVQFCIFRFSTLGWLT